MKQTQSELVNYRSVDLLTRLNGAFGRTVGFVAGKGIIAPPEPFLVPGAQELDTVLAGTFDQSIIPRTREADSLQVALALAPHPTTPIFVRNITSDRPLRAMLRVDATNANPFFVPTLNIVRASGFDDWNGRRGPKGDGTSSHTKIRQYARRPSSTTPPLGQASVYLQPNGLPLVEVYDGGHRAAAAHARRDTTVAIGGPVSFYKLDRNIAPNPSDQ
jgi:hypothetical protein